MKLVSIVLAAVLMGGCSLIQDRPMTARLTVQYAVLSYIDEDAGKASRVIERVDQALALVDDEEATIAAVEAAIRNKIDWRSLTIQDKLLADALMTEIGLKLEERIGDGVLNPQDRVHVKTALGWVKQAAQMVK